MKDPTPEELSAKYTAIADMQERRKAFLDDVASFYTSENRATSGPHCLYQTTKTSPGCAIGRCLPINGRPNKGTVNDPDVYKIIPAWMKEMDGEDFLASIQRLHDNPANWDSRGLTEKGDAMVTKLKQQYKLV